MAVEVRRRCSFCLLFKVSILSYGLIGKHEASASRGVGGSYYWTE